MFHDGVVEKHKCFLNSDNITVDCENNLVYKIGGIEPEYSGQSTSNFSHALQDTNISMQPNLYTPPLQVCSPPFTSSLPNPQPSSSSCAQNENIEMVNWNTRSIKMLISAYLEHMHKFTSPVYNKKKVWDAISSTLAKDGIKKSGGKCDEKWRNLKKTYERVLTERKKTGGQPVYWEFFNDFHNIYTKDPRYEPLATASSSGLYKKRNIDEVCETVENISPTSICTPTSKKTRTMSAYEYDQRKQKRHEERLALKREVFEWFKENFKKSGDQNKRRDEDDNNNY